MSKTELVNTAEAAQMKLLTTKSIQVQQHEVEKRTALAEIKSRLAQMVAFNREELKSQATARVEECKRHKLSTLKAKLKSYERQV